MRIPIHVVAPASKRLAVLAFLSAPPALLAGCGTRPPPGLLDGAAPVATTGVCQHTCTPDPLPLTVNCETEEAGLEFVYAGEFDDSNATGFYSYTDRTEPIANFVVPGTLMRKTWEPPTEALARCDSRVRDTTRPPNRTLHVRGGPFLSWGGGVGMAMRNFPPRTNCFGVNQPDYCTAKYTFAGAGSNAAFTFDLSKWEGISFWARRGPDSQAGIRVAVGDQYTDDDIAYYMYREDSDKPPAERRPLFCDRVRECACLNHMPCTTFQASRPEDFKFRECPPRDGTYCGLPQPQISGEYQTGTTDVQCNTCERTRCDEHFPAFPGEADPQFNGRPCSPHTLRSGVYSAFCFDPALGEKPAEADQQCGDHWTAPVNLTDQWRLYLIPFERMLQQGFGKRAVKLDTSAVAVVRFTWEGGWIDYWIDNLGFYRRRPQP